MKTLIIQAGDSGATKERVVEASPLTIGRATNQHVQLSDLRVALEHAEISLDGKSLQITASALTGVTVDGLEVRQAKIGVGSVIDLGLCTLKVVKRDGYDLALRIVDDGSARPDTSAQRAAYSLTLEDTGVSPRKWAVGLGLGVLALFLAWPIIGGLVPAVGDPVRQTGVSPEGAWTPGPPSKAHAFFMDDCAQCHATPFVRTQDTSCGSCHNDIGSHAASDVGRTHMDDAALNCHDCHREHNGADGLIAEHPRDCVSCHAKPDRFEGIALSPVRNFADHHPGFTPRVPVRTEAGLMFEEQPLGEAVEASGLHFNHAIHTDTAGIQGPDGMEVLACHDCHRPDAGRVGHQPINQQRDCARCHVMKFDTGDPDAELPHAPAALVQKTIEEHFVRRALEGDFETDTALTPRFNPARRRPGSPLTPAQRKSALEWAESRAEQTSKEVFSKSVCGVCHLPDRDAQGRWSVQSVALQTSFLTDHRFDHGGHASMDCTDCHATQDSDGARDLLLPGIDNCRACHGDWDDTDVAPSACVSCHGFHTTERPMLGLDTAKAAAP